MSSIKDIVHSMVKNNSAWCGLECPGLGEAFLKAGLLGDLASG